MRDGERTAAMSQLGQHIYDVYVQKEGRVNLSISGFRQWERRLRQAHTRISPIDRPFSLSRHKVVKIYGNRELRRTTILMFLQVNTLTVPISYFNISNIAKGDMDLYVRVYGRWDIYLNYRIRVPIGRSVCGCHSDQLICISWLRQIRH